MRAEYSGEVDRLMAAEDPSLAFLARRDLANEDPTAPSMRRLQARIRTSPRISALLEGHAREGASTYGKWKGAHWVVLHLAFLAHPGGDERVEKLVDETLAHWTAPRFLRDEEVRSVVRSPDFVPVIAGKARRCASQQGGALLAAVTLGHRDDARVTTLADRLIDWQWPDGGWNCDRNVEARMSSVNETFLPLRGLLALGDREDTGDRACEFLLDRQVICRRTDGEPLHPVVAQLHYPAYWHYDLLAGLTALADGRRLGDARCARALDLLESLRLEEGGWPAHAKWYKVAGSGSNIESVGWGATGAAKPNDWVTLDALRVLAHAGRI
jgi:hypothetical protein